MLSLIENDYALVRKYESESGSFGSFIRVVVQRRVIDHYIQAHGKWRPSREAERLGAPAVELERLLHRDQRSLEEALPILQEKHPGISKQTLETFAERLPRRQPRRLPPVSLDEGAADVAVPPAPLASEQRQLSDRVSVAMSDALAALVDKDRSILRLIFGAGLSVAEASRRLRIEQKAIYKRREYLLRRLRKELGAVGIDRRDIEDLFTNDDPDLHFELAGGRNGVNKLTESDDEEKAVGNTARRSLLS